VLFLSRHTDLKGMTVTATVMSATQSETMNHHQFVPRFRISGFFAKVTKMIRLNANVKKIVKPIKVAKRDLLKQKPF
jgi:hypothetical protein